MPDPAVAQQAALVAGAVLVVVVALVVLARVLRRRRRPAARAEPVLDVDLSRLAVGGPPASGPVLECSGVPVRLAVLVVAPQGRQPLPATADELARALDQIAPGLGDLLAPHGTLLRRWPPQLSPRGFANAFFAHMRLPGERGRGTPWCGVAGRVDAGDSGLLVGMALSAAAPNSLGQITIERPQQWREVLRVRT